MFDIRAFYFKPVVKFGKGTVSPFVDCCVCVCGCENGITSSSGSCRPSLCNQHIGVSIVCCDQTYFFWFAEDHKVFYDAGSCKWPGCGMKIGSREEMIVWVSVCRCMNVSECEWTWVNMSVCVCVCVTNLCSIWSGFTHMFVLWFVGCLLRKQCTEQ